MATSYSIFSGSSFVNEYDVKSNEADSFFETMQKVHDLLSPISKSFFHIFSEYELEDGETELQLLMPDPSTTLEIENALKTFYS